MDNNNKNIINKIYTISITVLSVIVGLIFILCAYSIYYKGLEIRVEQPNYQIYNEEILGKYLIFAFIPFILWVLLIIGGVIISHLFPLNTKKKFKVDELETYYKLSKRIPKYDENYASQYKIINKEKNFRKIGLLITSILSILCMIYPARYLFDKDNFAANKVIEAKLMALNVLPWIAFVFIIFAVYLVIYTNSIKKELVQIKEILKTYKTKITKEEKDYNLAINITRISVLVVGIVFVILGVINGGVNDVLQKAINICTECIGLA